MITGVWMTLDRYCWNFYGSDGAMACYSSASVFARYCGFPADIVKFRLHLKPSKSGAVKVARGFIFHVDYPSFYFHQSRGGIKKFVASGLYNLWIEYEQ